MNAANWFDTHYSFTVNTPGLQLKGLLLSRHLEAVWMAVIGCLLHLHAVHSNPAAHSETLANQAELRSAAQQEVVELWREVKHQSSFNSQQSIHYFSFYTLRCC